MKGPFYVSINTALYCRNKLNVVNNSMLLNMADNQRLRLSKPNAAVGQVPWNGVLGRRNGKK